MRYKFFGISRAQDSTFVIEEHRILAKAETPENRSDAIVVSFDNIWYAPLHRHGFSAIIRKRVPTRFKPSWIYFHINAPKSAICARAPLKRIDHVDLKSVIDMKEFLGLSRDEIIKYVGPSASIGVYILERIDLAPVEVSINQLAEHLIYHPPQSFFALSTPAKTVVDRLCAFQAGRSSHRLETRA